MFNIKIAELVIAVDNKYDFVLEKCREYLTEDVPQFSVRVSNEELSQAIADADDGIRGMSDLEGYAESICIYRKICYKLPEYGAFLFHSAAVEYAGKAYLFSAPSGTGKTTHLKLWMRSYREKLHIINGDKPILRVSENGKFTVYGTPWSGKEGWQSNRSAPLGGICFLARGEENRIRRLSSEEAAPMALKQILFPKSPASLKEMLGLTDRLLSSVPIYQLYCTISQEAAKLSFEALTGEKG